MAGLAGVPPAMTLSLTTLNRGQEKLVKTNPILLPEREHAFSKSHPERRFCAQREPAGSLSFLEVCGNYGSLVGARADEPLALVACDIEVELVAFDFGQFARHHHRAPGSSRREMPDVYLIADCCLAFWKQTMQRLVAGPLHQPDHGGGRECAFAAHVAGDQVAFDHSLQAPFEPRPDAIRCRQHLDCP
jgi:hypothetical protein